MTAAVRGIGWAAAAVTLAALAAGYGGALHPAGDSLAVFRVPLAVAAGLLLAMLWRPRRAVAPGLALVALALLPRLWAMWPGPGPGPEGVEAQAGLVIYQKNLLFNLPDPRRLVADIAARSPDVVTLQEVSPRNRAVLAALRDRYPYQHDCAYRAVGGTAVLSRWPAVPGSARCAHGLTALQVETPAGRVWAVSLHLRWPWPHPQAAQLDRLGPVLRAMRGPMVIGGDFNSVAWSDALARVARASGTRRAGHEAASFALPYGGFGVAIDHVLASGARPGTIEVLDRMGSDHRGILARVTVAP
ncbi:endonuclease/exonuclease/phosphatase family protein [Antarcticimicrobium luteum]|uniref:Endonuclease n=1 Tax=Antarcticimicrobium luteum TaxID=2547397 RepID=A0A4R5VFY4_9RHOB|nr:endonuclease/exonuclease/phosphatase family protein [Antarcticimicrobium luteum]TDK51281.1 endonuclease [Antarcticimicrobium luteum]